MLNAGWKKVLPVVPQLILPIKTALNTRNKSVIVKVLKILRQLAFCDAVSGAPLIGQALVPYYRQILPIMNIFISRNGNDLARQFVCPALLIISNDLTQITSAIASTTHKRTTKILVTSSRRLSRR